jgi:hypothetical protein
MEAWVGDGEHECFPRGEHSREGREQRADFGHVHDSHRANGLIESARSKRQEDLGIGRVNDVVFDRRIAGRVLASTCDEFRAVVERDHTRPELRHPPGESSCAACGVENRVPRNDVQEAFRGRLDQHRLVIVAVTDPVVPPEDVRVPYPAILVGLFGELSILTLGCQVSRPMSFGAGANMEMILSAT